MKQFYTGLILLCLGLSGCNGNSQTIDYQKKIAQDTFIQGSASQGETLFNQPVVGATNAPGCVTCHFAEADQNLIGPSQVGLATLAENTLQNPDYTGQALSVEGYLWEATIAPNAYVDPQYGPVMFAQYDQRLTEQELADLVAYMLTLKE